MQEFKAYLELKEIELSKTTEYLAFYALPYIQNPRVSFAYNPRNIRLISIYLQSNGLKSYPIVLKVV
jgi:hypothetical protein